MSRMGKTEEDWNGLKLVFLKTVQPNSFSKLIPAACNFKNNAQETQWTGLPWQSPFNFGVRWCWTVNPVSSVVRCHHWDTQVKKEVYMYSWNFFAYPLHGIQNPCLCWFPSHGDILTLPRNSNFHWWLQYPYAVGSGISNKDDFRGDINKASWERP